MKVLKNYKPKKEMLEEFPYAKLIDSEDVLVDLPICAAEFGKEYKKPVVYGNYKGIPTIYEEEEVILQLEKLKLFHFTEDKGKLTEVEPEKATIKVRLPIDTKVDELVFDNGQIFWAKPVDDKPVEGVEAHGNN